ncbi:MAG: hypothetical protein FWD46_02100 [Cystobacterineae bacterium]|nr:hypothetical protein [Cystobacterineae bacterium]
MNKRFRNPVQVEVIRRPSAGKLSPVPPEPFTRPSSPSLPRIEELPPPAPRAAFPTAARRVRQTVTPAAIEALAKKERVPVRIAKGELDGKMKCRIWKRLHPKEAEHFECAYRLQEQHPHLNLNDAFGLLQSNMTVDEFAKRRARIKKKDELRVARASVSSLEIDAWFKVLMEAQEELSFVLAESTLRDKIRGLSPLELELEKTGLMEKLHIVAIARSKTWEQLTVQLLRDLKLAQKPSPVPRQPTQRPVGDPRPFLSHRGKTLNLFLRNGINLELPLLATGPFDLLVGTPGNEILVPLHALLGWNPLD